MKEDGVCTPLSVVSAQGGSSVCSRGEAVHASLLRPSLLHPRRKPPQGLGTVAVGTSPLRIHVLTEFSDQEHLIHTPSPGILSQTPSPHAVPPGPAQSHCAFSWELGGPCLHKGETPCCLGVRWPAPHPSSQGPSGRWSPSHPTEVPAGAGF